MSEEKTLRIERVFAATPEEVFDAWTVPEQLAAWWGPDGVTIPEKSIDLREGGNWRTVMQNSDGSRFIVSGVYRTIDRPKRLVFTWAWDQDDGSRGHETEVTVTLEPAGSGTRLTLLQKIFANTEQRDMHREGWTSSFDCLERFVADDGRLTA